MAIADYPGDLGIVLYLAGNPSGVTYIDRKGVTQAAATLSGTYNAMPVPPAVGGIDTAQIFAGLGADHTFFARLDFDGATSITVKVEQKYNNDPRIDTGWMLTQTVRQDTGVVASEQVFLSTGPGTQLYIAIQTASAYVSGQLRVSAKAAGVLTANDRVEVALKCL
jgi:hypothetical protein